MIEESFLLVDFFCGQSLGNQKTLVSGLLGGIIVIYKNSRIESVTLVDSSNENTI